MTKWWNENYKSIIGYCVAIVLGTAISVAWRHYSEHRAQHATARLLEAQAQVDAGKYDQAAAIYEAVVNKYSKEAPLARLKQAHTLIRADRKDKAAEVLAGASGDKGLTDLAMLQSVLLSPDSADSEAKLRTLSAPGRPFAYTAKELLLFRLTHEEGKAAEAQQLYAQLAADPLAPPSLRERVAQWMPDDHKVKP